MLDYRENTVGNQSFFNYEQRHFTDIFRAVRSPFILKAVLAKEYIFFPFSEVLIEYELILDTASSF